MNNTEQRIAIATACGWKLRNWVDRKQRLCTGWDAPDGRKNVMGPPDYIDDLNAMHKAEMSLTVDQQDDFQDNLWRVVAEKPEQVDGRKTIGDWRKYTHSTAAQRAEAFLKTLNLWVK